MYKYICVCVVYIYVLYNYIDINHHWHQQSAQKHPTGFSVHRLLYTFVEGMAHHIALAEFEAPIKMVLIVYHPIIPQREATKSK